MGFGQAERTGEGGLDSLRVGTAWTVSEVRMNRKSNRDGGDINL